MAHGFIGSPRLVNLHQEGFHNKFLHAAGLPKHAFGMNVEMKMPRLNRPQRSRFFRSFPLRCLAMREAGVGRSLLGRPLISAVGIYQGKLDPPAPRAGADRGGLERQTSFYAGWTHVP